MRTKSLPFQLEQTIGGAFLLQGLAGGMLLGFIYMVAMLLAYPHLTNLAAIFYTVPLMAVTGVFGLIKAIPLWIMYLLTGNLMRAPVRVAFSTISLTLLLSLLGYLLGATDPWSVVPVAGWSFVVSLPTALLVGSRVRPWEILTYWRVTFREHGIKERLSSSGMLGLGGVLPLRLLSIGGLGIWILASAATLPLRETNVTQVVLFYLIPITYLAVSAYLTFSSPGQFILLAIGLVINLPISYMSFFGYNIFPEGYWSEDTAAALLIADTIFLGAWTAFVAARFIVKPNHLLPLHAFVKVSSHDCLGSRFLEWREHTA